MRLERLGLDEWGRLLPDSGYEVFHHPDALSVLADHTDASMRLYGVFKGQEPVGLVPVFVGSKGIGRMVTSPPPSMAVPRLGPIVMPTSPKQRKRESVNQEVIELVLDAVDADSPRSLFRVECSLDYDDPRPFQWADFEVGQEFTYVLDLESTTSESVIKGFSSDLRKEIRRAEDTDVTVTVEGAEAAATVYEDVAARYDEQGEQFPVERSFLVDVVSTLEDRSRVYVARDGSGEYLSGIVVLYAAEFASYWQGGVRATYENTSINSLIHWAVITDVLGEDGPDVSGYDLVGANTPRLCWFKSKFGADLVPYYTVESAGIRMALAKRAYSLVAK